MTAIELTFPSGRFHATPWGRHVNEGAIEWPPSPWRLLRALVATWKRKAPDLDESTMRDLLTALCVPPEYALPAATFSHTRHYMPWFKKGPGDKTLVFDSFVALAKDAPVRVVWPGTELNNTQKAALTELLPLMGTLGRAESWCQGKLLDHETAAAVLQSGVNCRPINGQAATGEVVRVLGVDPDTAFSNEQNPRHEAARGRGKDRTVLVTPLYDPDWHLCIETLWLHEKRWSMPPGCMWIDYDRPKDALAQLRPRIVRRTARPAMQVARFALDSTVLPRLTDTVRIAEAVRIALMSRYGWLTKVGDEKGKSRVFSGKEADGAPVKNHRHCYYLPTDENGDGRLDHLTIYAADGFGPDELRAIDSLRQVKTRDTEGSGHPLSVVLVGIGKADQLQTGPMKLSRHWVSATPFIAPRHPKTSGRLKHTEIGGADLGRFLTEQIRQELSRWMDRSGGGVRLESVGVELLADEFGNTRRWCAHRQEWRERAIQFRRFRQKRDDDGGRRPTAFFRLTFPEPVAGPIALGHSSHFGLGLFIPSP